MKNDLISRSALKKALLDRSFFPAIVKAALENAPAVDAVEVVRCKDCTSYDFGECVNYRMDMSDGAHFYPYPNDFCSYGERRTDDATD
jgi:hypothetical protein